MRMLWTLPQHRHTFDSGAEEQPGRVHRREAVNKGQLVEALESRLGGRKAAAEAVDAVIDTIVRQVAKGERVAISGFGTFEKAARAARTGRNPRTGETVKIKKTSVPRFKAGTAFKGFVANPKTLPKAATGAAAKAVGTAGRAAAGARAATTRGATRGAADTRKATSTGADSDTAAAKKATRSTAKPTGTTSNRGVAKKVSASKATAGSDGAAAKKTAKGSTAAKSPAAKKNALKKSAASGATATTARKTATKRTAKA
jgi:DNA-binding protein HU-beta